MLPHSIPSCPCGCQAATPRLCWLSIVAPPAAPRRPGPLSPPVRIYGPLIIWEL